jgi:hypothetical protein
MIELTEKLDKQIDELRIEKKKINHLATSFATIYSLGLLNGKLQALTELRKFIYECEEKKEINKCFQ